jgi:glycerol-3-phosphate acyltransferase PlsX
LLSIGTEESKGHKTIQQANELLRSMGNLINYQGPIEGFDVFENRVDVVVCDGFTGNILLKTSEALFRTLRSVIKDEIMRKPLRKLGGLLVRGAFADVKERLNPDRYAGAPLLGCRATSSRATARRTCTASPRRSASPVNSSSMT